MGYSCFKAEFTFVGECCNQFTVKIHDLGSGYFIDLITSADGAPFEFGEIESIINRCLNAAASVEPRLLEEIEKSKQ